MLREPPRCGKHSVRIAAQRISLSRIVLPVLAIPSISSSSQYQANGVTPLGNGSSTNQSSVVLGATVNSSIYRNVQLQVEVEPSGTPFMNAPNVTSSPFVAPGSIATTTFTGANGSYHWQGRAADVQSDVSSWWPFGTTSTTPKAFQYDHRARSRRSCRILEIGRSHLVLHPEYNFNASGTVSYDSASWEILPISVHQIPVTASTSMAFLLLAA